MQPKFSIGEKVRFVGDKDIDAGMVLSYSYVPELKTFRYSISSREVSVATKELIDGIKTCLESELISVKE